MFVSKAPWVVLLVLASCAKQDDAETAPSLSALEAIYAAPTGTFDPAAPDPSLRMAEDRLTILDIGKANTLATELVAAIDLAIRQANLTPNAHAVPLRVDGTARLDVPCGKSKEEVAHLEVAVDDGELASSIWGEVRGCGLWGLGSLNLSLQGQLVIQRYPANALLVRIEGTALNGSSPLRLDFRIENDRIASRISTARGDVIATLHRDTIQVRSANGTFDCQRRARSCVKR